MQPTSYGVRRLPVMAAPAGDAPAQAGALARVAPLPRVGIIRNPRSHRNKGIDAQEPADCPVSIAAPRRKADIGDALAQFAQDGIGLLVIDGGDGTIRDVLSRGAPIFKDAWPQVAVLPKGKTNALGVDLGVPRLWTLNEALEAAKRGSTVARRPLVVKRLDAEQPVRLGFFLGAGVFNAAIAAGQVAHRAGAFQSFAVGVTAAFGVGQSLLGFGKSPWRSISPMRIQPVGIPGGFPRSAHTAPEGRFLFALSTLTKFPVGIRPFPWNAGDRSADRGAINYFVIDAPLRRAMAMLPVALYGRDTGSLDKLGIHRGAAHEFGLELGESFILDGETYPAGDYRVSAGPELHFIVP